MNLIDVNWSQIRFNLGRLCVAYLLAWTPGLIGITVASDRFEVAVLLSALMYLTLRFGRKTEVRGPKLGLEITG